MKSAKSNVAERGVSRMGRRFRGSTLITCLGQTDQQPILGNLIQLLYFILIKWKWTPLRNATGIWDSQRLQQFSWIRIFERRTRCGWNDTTLSKYTQRFFKCLD